MHIWLVELKAILQKANVSLSYCKDFSLIKQDKYVLKNHSLNYSFQNKVLLLKLECWEPP